MHWVLAATSAVLWPLLHAGLPRMPAPEQLPEAMPIVEMGGADDEQPLEIEGDLPTMISDAARRGRVDRTLELLDAGADPADLPAADASNQRSLPVLAVDGRALS